MNKLCIFAILVLGCSIGLYGQTELQKQRIASEIRAVMDGQVVAWNRGDIEAFMQGYWNSENLVFVSTNVTRGWKPTLERYKKSYDSREKMGTLTFADLEITVLSKHSAVVLGSWALVRTSDNPKGKFTLIFRRLKEGWRIVHDHTS
jgi:beta-aspartyl-peptidase (threonine type)